MGIAVLGVDPPFPRVVVQPDRDSDTYGLNGVVYINASGGISYILAETLGGNFSPSGGTLAVGNNVKSFDAALDANGDLLLFYSSGEGDSFDPRVVTFAEFEWQGGFMGPLPIETTDLASFVTTNSTTPLRLDATPSGRAAMLYVGSGGGVEFWAYE